MLRAAALDHAMKVIGSISVLIAVLLSFLLAVLLAASPARAEPIATGQRTADANGTPLTVFTHPPPERPAPSLVLVFHAPTRAPDRYRASARPPADRHSLLVVAPLFDRHDFPSWRYQRGGIVRTNGTVRPPRAWTGQLVL